MTAIRGSLADYPNPLFIEKMSLIWNGLLIRMRGWHWQH